MKKLILALTVLLIPSISQADIFEKLKELPSLKQGVAYSITDNQFNYLATAELVTFKGFTLEAGYAGRADETNDKLVGVLSYHLLDLKNIVNIPILNLVEFNPGIYVGMGRIGGNNETDWGISATLINLHF